MTRLLRVVFGLCLGAGASLCVAQIPDSTTFHTPPDTVQTYNYDLDFGVGFSRIENAAGKNERFLTLAFMPEFFYGDVSIGLLLVLRRHMRTGNLRREDFNTFSDYLGLIRYVQYGEEDEAPLYGRFGVLEYATLGYGQQINFYTNTTSLDDPKHGLAFQYEDKGYQVEAMIGNLPASGIFGVRASYTPIPHTTRRRLQPLVLGISLSGDLSAEGAFINPEAPGQPFLLDPPPAGTTGVGQGFADGRLFIIGLDAGLPLHTTEQASLLSYFELAKIFDYGMGVALGARSTWRFPERRRLDVQFEQRLLGKQYLPNYFDALYELERVQQVRLEDEDGETLEGLDTKRNRLAAQRGVRFGSYAALTFRSGHIFRLQTSFERVWNRAHSGWFHLDTRLRSRNLPLHLRLVYDRINLRSFNDLFNGPRDEALFRVSLAYRFWPFIMLGFDYQQSFEPVKAEGVVIGRVKRQRIEPRVQVVLAL